MIQEVKHTAHNEVLLNSIWTKIISVFRKYTNETNTTCSKSISEAVKKTDNIQKPAYRHNYFAGPHCYF